MNLNIEYIFERIDCIIDVDMIVEHVVVGLVVNFQSDRVGWIEDVGLKVFHVAQDTEGRLIIIESKEILHDFYVVDVLEYSIHCGEVGQVLLGKEINHVVIIYA